MIKNQLAKISKSPNLFRFFLVVAIVLVFVISRFLQNAAQGDADLLIPETDFWGIPPGYSLEIDTQGYNLPTAIAFVPEPGDNPSDPLYFVTELSGTIKVVTQDRSIHTFARDFYIGNPATRVEELANEFGMAGICLAPEQGAVFVTFSTALENNLFQNHIYRFDTGVPQEFAQSYSNAQEISDIFSDFPGGPSHQIGHCAVKGDQLFVSTGDGLYQYDPPLGLGIPLGKILRFTLEGTPHPENPFFDSMPENPYADYVFAYGFRNPFGISLVNDEVFVADNGIALDRFLNVEIGRNYLWNGTDNSIGARANATFYPAIGAAQMAAVPQGNYLFPPQFNGGFFIGSTSDVVKGLTYVPYDFEQNEVSQPTESFLVFLKSYANKYYGIVPAVALGPDGLYFAPLMTPGKEVSSVFRIVYDPEHEHPFRREEVEDPEILISKYSCRGCHVINGNGGNVGPSLDGLSNRLAQRLKSDAYLGYLEHIDTLQNSPFPEYQSARDRIRELSGIDQVVHVWIVFHLLEPQFDNDQATMPNLGITEDQAEIIAKYLISLPKNR